MHYTIRDAKPSDIAQIREFILDLAEVEKLRHKVRATEEELSKWLFGKTPRAYCLMAEVEGKAIGFALYFYNFSTFLGKPGIYIEDLFVKESHRGHGIGKAFFSELAKRADDEGLERLQWWVINWNDPAIEFYKSIGAYDCSEWTVMRVDGDNMKKLISNS